MQVVELHHGVMAAITKRSWKTKVLAHPGFLQRSGPSYVFWRQVWQNLVNIFSFMNKNEGM